MNPLMRFKKSRELLIITGGWIFAGDVTRDKTRITLTNAVWVFGWKDVGFAKIIETEIADIRHISDITFPATSELFSIPVHTKWGIAAANTAAEHEKAIEIAEITAAEAIQAANDANEVLTKILNMTRGGTSEEKAIANAQELKARANARTMLDKSIEAANKLDALKTPQYP